MTITWIKHARSEKNEKTGKYNFQSANQKNVLTALAAYFIRVQPHIRGDMRDLGDAEEAAQVEIIPVREEW